jgi:rRNA-processing protein FCF1
MAWLIDGSNVLGAMRLDRASVDAKRELARLAASFARAKRTRVTCYFDGNEPPAFARHLGNTTIVFSGARSADDLIAQRSEENAASMTVVTSDRELTSRVARRRVKVITSQQFVAMLRTIESEPGEASADDWLAYFSDPKNREGF